MLTLIVLIILVIAVITLFGQISKIKKRLDIGTMGVDEKKTTGSET